MRHYDFDWIRTIVILNLIPLHVVWLMLFIPGYSQVDTTSMTALLLKLYISLVSSWHMPLLFLISGYCRHNHREKSPKFQPSQTTPAKPVV